MELSHIIGLSSLVVSLFALFYKVFSNLKIFKIVVDYVSFYETAYLKLINKSKRPITIASIAMKMDGEPVPSGAMFALDEEEINFPKVVQEYTSVQLKFSEELSGYILEERAKNLSIEVFDIEGKVYSKYKLREINGKWGDIDKKVG